MDNTQISKHLGQKSEYKDQYDASLLVRELRASNRTHLNIKDEAPPFVGYDTWNHYEVSALTDSGLPIAAIAKIVYTSNNEYIVESKSLKLYFNSLNMTKLGTTTEVVLKKIAEIAASDLSALLETEVNVYVFEDVKLKTLDCSSDGMWFDDCVTLESICNTDVVIFDKYSETPSLLEVVEKDEPTRMNVHSALLRSRCRVTSQPDSGDVFIHIKSSKLVTPLSLLKYVVSFRDECHFHEEICETIYTRLNDLLQPEELVVRCLYARRGSIDINPERASSIKLLNYNLQDANIPHTKTSRQ